jgi:dihydrofolate synthase/folylpolyglutamate synthase
MDYAESRSYIQAALTFGIRLGLERMQALLDLLGHPEAGLRVIHVAGTNGKGSTSSIVRRSWLPAGPKLVSTRHHTSNVSQSGSGSSQDRMD